jgi:hypothetical protein
MAVGDGAEGVAQGAVPVSISWEAKMREATRIAALNLPGRATDLAIVLLRHLNPDLGVAMPSVELLADELRTSQKTVERASSALNAAGVARYAKRRGAAARWFPALMEMQPEEAKRRVNALIETWKAKGRIGKPDDPSSLRGQIHDPSEVPSPEPANPPPKMRDLKTPNMRSKGKGTSSPARPPSEEAFQLVDQLAEIAGLTKDSATWPDGWRFAQRLAQSWIDRGWTTDLCNDAAKDVMAKKREGPPNSMKYFEPAIKRLESQPTEHREDLKRATAGRRW